MEEIYESIFSEEEMPVVYATFWQRLGAVIIDGLIFLVVIFPLNFYNEITWKSVALLLVFSLLTVAYKPFCEYWFGATVGKMALKIVVINSDYQRPSLQQALLRNIFPLIFSGFNLLFTLLVFRNPQFIGATTLRAYATLRKQMGFTDLLTVATVMVYIVDAICLLADSQKRALHDRIGATYVIRKT